MSARAHTMPSPDRGRPARSRAGVTWTVLLLVLTSRSDAAAVGEGLLEGGLPTPELACPPPAADAGERRADPGAALAELELDRRMRAARALVILAERLDEQTLLGSLAFEAATRARQAGVPCYAITRHDDLDLFDARILDLQVVMQARSPQALRRAGARLAEIV